MSPEEARKLIGIQGPWESRADGYWVESEGLNVLKMAEIMAEAEARFITITARPVGSGYRLVYHWDLDGLLLNFATFVENGEIPSIFSSCQAADWIEREIHDYYAIRFTGRDDLQCLVLRSDEQPGMFQWADSEEEQ